MSDDAKQFIFGLEQCRALKGMKWAGKIPPEIIELFDLKISEIKHGYKIAGVYVTTNPRYEMFKRPFDIDSSISVTAIAEKLINLDKNE